MARNYAALPHEYLEEMGILSDAEFGRLCRALLQFSMTGEEGRLQGAEKVLAKRVYMQELRFQKSYDEVVEARRETARKKANKRWHTPAMPGNAEQCSSIETETETKTETNTEIKTETDIPPSADGRDKGAAGAARPPRKAEGNFQGAVAALQELHRLFDGEEER